MEKALIHPVKIRNNKKTQKKRIAFLINSFYDEFETQVFRGIEYASQEHGVNLLCFVGGTINNPYFDDTGKNAAYKLADTDSVDGILALSVSIHLYVRNYKYRRFLESFHPRPVLSIGEAFESIPSVVVDNRSGMRELMTHLIMDHGYRRIACIRGPENSADAEARFAAYKESLLDYEIPFQPELVCSGSFYHEAGDDAISELLDVRHVEFDAVVAANDYVALRAALALKSRGIRVPEDVAVAGFDNNRESKNPDASLTTIDQSAFKLGCEAVKSLLCLIERGTTEHEKKITSELVIRHSCGCAQHLSGGEMPGRVTGTFAGREGESSVKSIDSCVRELAVLMRSEFDTPVSGSAVVYGHAESLVSSLLDEVKGDVNNGFADTLTHVIDAYLRYSSNMLSWSRIINFLFSNVMLLANPDPVVLLPILLSAYSSAERQVSDYFDKPMLLSIVRDMEFLFLTQKLGAIVEMNKLDALIRRDFPRFGVSSCCIFMRKPAEGEPVKYLRAIGYREGDDAAIPGHERESVDGKSIVRIALEVSSPGPLFFLSFVYSNKDVGFGCFAMKKEYPVPFVYLPAGSGHLFTEKISEKLGDVIEGILLYERMKEQTDRVRETAKEPKDVELIYEKLNLTEEKAAHYFRDLLIFMETKKPFKDDDITLLKLSKMLNISRNQLSFIINENSGVNFYDFLNTYRVEYAIRLMDRKKDDSERILDIALKAGFKSKSTFNKIFKKHTGRTPKEYRDDPNTVVLTGNEGHQ